MNRYDPPDGTTPDLFGQLHTGFVESEIESSIADFEVRERALELESKVMDEVPIASFWYIAMREKIKDDRQLLRDAQSSLENILEVLSLESKEITEAYFVLRAIELLAEACTVQEAFPRSDSEKREYQRVILTDDGIPGDIKEVLIQAADVLLRGPGIDITNPNDALRAINECDQQEKKTAFEKDIRVKAKNEFERRLGTIKQINRNDPEYTTLVNHSSRFIATRVAEAVFSGPSEVSSGTFMYELTVNEAVSALGLDVTEVIQVCQQVIDELVDSHKPKARY
jgi:hypothetical protein